MRRGLARLGGLGAAAVIIASSCSTSAAPEESDTGATSPQPTVAETPQDPPPAPALDAARVEAGAGLYEQYCASCHQADLSGEPDWKVPNDDGTLKPPPQDSTGHTWHHSDQQLLALIRNGIAIPTSRMPTFGATLTDAEILTILEYFKSRWGEQERAFQWEVTWQEAHRDDG